MNRTEAVAVWAAAMQALAEELRREQAPPGE
jgi:hypothetical protein